MHLCFRRSDTGSRHADAETCGTEYTVSCVLSQRTCKEKRYHFTNRALTYSILEFGDLVNTVAPVHIRPDSVTHHLLAKFVKMDGETEDFCAYGDALMYGGAHLHPAFGGTGYNENVRYFPDFASRLYLMDCNL